MISTLPNTSWTLTALVLTVLLLITTAGLLWQQYRYRRLRTHYRSVVEERDQVLAATARHSGQEPTAFAADLNQAELTTRFQYPRPRDYGAIAERTAPERYRYAHRLSRKGMEAEQIASLLTISRHEAQQLVHLSRLSSS
ncbi:MAG: hypothetical protein IH612_07010 [Desulfofustis sp.]|nr:hypothetical protein [Desulfofustis sp.]